MQPQQAGVGGDEHSDFVGDFLFAAHLEILLGGKDLDMPFQFLLVGGWQARIKWEAAQEEFPPWTWEGLAVELLSATLLQEAEHGRPRLNRPFRAWQAVRRWSCVS
jgi:hypothetical protein